MHMENENKIPREDHWFCQCCVLFHKRKDATVLRRATQQHARYVATGLCDRCYKEAGNVDLSLVNSYIEDGQLKESDRLLRNETTEDKR